MPRHPLRSRGALAPQAAAIFLVLNGLGMHGSPQQNVGGSRSGPTEDAILTGTVLSANYAVLQWGTVAVRKSTSGETLLHLPVDRRGGYATSLPGGIYDIDISSHGLLPYRRANVLIQVGQRYTINIYPTQHTGTAMTIHGDIALPDPEVHYDEFAAGSGLKLVIQYQKRSRKDTIAYEGAPLIATFDTATIVAYAATLNPATLVVTLEHATRLDLNGNVTQSTVFNSPQVELDTTHRALRILSSPVQTLRF